MNKPSLQKKIGMLGKLFGHIGRCENCGGGFKELGLTLGHVARAAHYSALSREGAKRRVYRGVANRCPSCQNTICIDCLHQNERDCPICDASMDWGGTLDPKQAASVAPKDSPGLPGEPAPTPLNFAVPPKAPSGREAIPEDFGAFASSDAWQLRQQILQKSPLRKCCEIPASAPVEGSEMLDELMAKVMKGAPSGRTCERVVLYRMDGQSLSEAETYKHVVELLATKGKTDPEYLSLVMKFVSAGYVSGDVNCRATPVPILGFSIKLDGDKQDVVAKCELLATTEFMGPDADFMTRGTGFTEDGVSYRVYSYWKQP